MSSRPLVESKHDEKYVSLSYSRDNISFGINIMYSYPVTRNKGSKIFSFLFFSFLSGREDFNKNSSNSTSHPDTTKSYQYKNKLFFNKP